jgi:hypothetical protein
MTSGCLKKWGLGKEIHKFLEFNENAFSTYQKFWNTSKTVLKEQM